MNKDAKKRTLIRNKCEQVNILMKYHKLGAHNMYESSDYDYYRKQLEKNDFKDDIDEYYRLSCINLLVKGYNV